MSSSILDDIADTINEAFGDIFYDATLTRDTLSYPASPAGAHDAFDPQPGNVTSTSYTCKALEIIYYERAAPTFAKVRMRKVMILTSSLSVTPTTNDRLAIDGFDGTFTIKDVDADPARATWTCTEMT